MPLCKATSRQGNFRIVREIFQANTVLKDFFYGLGEKPNGLQLVLASILGRLPGVHVYLEDNLVAGIREGPWRMVQNNVFQVLNDNNAAVK